MSNWRATFTQSYVTRLFRAAVEARARLELRPDGTIIATAEEKSDAALDGALASETPEDLKKLI